MLRIERQRSPAVAMKMAVMAWLQDLSGSQAGVACVVVELPGTKAELVA